VPLYRFQVDASLARIAGQVGNIEAMKRQAVSECKLLTFYDVRLPPIQADTGLQSTPAHQPSVELLSRYNPWILSRFQPADVLGDGNCLYRSLSYALYGTECHHVILRLFSVLEVLINRQLYDSQHAGFYAPFKADTWLVLPTYADFVSSLAKINSYCDMLAVLAASSVTQKSIQTIWPIPVNPGQLSPMTKLVIGRDVASTCRPVIIMWTAATSGAAVPEINHFVPLMQRHTGAPAVEVIDCSPEKVVHQSTAQAYIAEDIGTNAADVLPTAHAENGIPLPLGIFLSFASCINILANPDQSRVVPNVPNGIKSNVYFIVSNTDNDKRVLAGQRRVFVDDCGAWTRTRGNNSVVVGDSPKELVEQDGRICARKRIDGKDRLVPLEPQPDAATVTRVTRYSYRLKRCDSYCKRVTLLSNSAVHLCEYVGDMPQDFESHGNAKAEGSHYVRTRPDVTSTITQKCTETRQKPKKIYEDMLLQTKDEDQCPRNIKQVQNISVAVNAELMDSKIRGTNNLADEMLTLCSLVKDGEFVRTVSFNSGHAPCAILYSNEQLQDVKRFCGADAPDNVRSVLCVDRTFNVSSLFLTITVFKNMSVVRCGTQQPPIFLGPMFLHGDGAFVTYLTCFMTLRGMLETDVQATELRTLDGLVTGSDEELALVKALRVAFPDSRQLYCVIHCRDNVRDYLTKTGVSQTVREELVRLLFGTDGLAMSPDENAFEDRRAQVLQYVRQYCVDVENYVASRTIPKLLTNCETLWKAPWLGVQRWTNNSCESANNLIKLALDWKPARLTELVHHLHSLVKAQYRGVQRAMIGQGDFIIAGAFAHHRVPFCRWQGLSETQKQELTDAFLADRGLKCAKTDGTVTSSDGSLTVTGTNKVARKPGQRKRPRTERAGIRNK